MNCFNKCDRTVRLVPCSVYTMRLVARRSPFKGLQAGTVNRKIAKFRALLLKFVET